MSALRWLLIVPAAVAVWYLVLVGMFTYAFVDSSLCPPTDLVSGHCVNFTIRRLLDLTMHVFAGASACAVMVVAVLVAPGHKKPVAWITLAGGLVVAALLAASTRHWPLFAAAAMGGFVALAIILRWLPSLASNSANSGSGRATV
jgi:hypothetical protein